MTRDRTVCLLLAVALLLTGVGCGPASEKISSDPVSTSSTSKAITKKGRKTTTSQSISKTEDTAAESASNTTTTQKPTTQSSTAPKETTKMTTTKKTTSYLDYDRYTLAAYTQPIWSGNVVYNETVMFVPDAASKKVEAAPLLYKPETILSVRSFDLKTEYKEGVDYVVTKEGRIQRTVNSAIPVWEYDDYYCKEPSQYGLPSISAPGRFLKYGEGKTFQYTQVAVTYTHKGEWDGPVPTYQGDKLPKTMALLKASKPMSIVYNGDSVMVSAEASGWHGFAPFMPTFTEMITDGLREEYNCGIIEKNTAVGGTASAWGVENVQENILKYAPNLVVLRFGGNDDTQLVSPDQFKKNIKQIIQTVRQTLPDCEFVLMSNFLPNMDVDHWDKGQSAKYQQVQEELTEELDGVVLVKMLNIIQHTLTHKRYWDMTGNNINHQNDFGLRLHAQAVLATLIENY